MSELADLFSDFFAWMEALPPGWAYVMLFAIAYGENVFPPIPGDMIIVFGGYLVGVGTLSFPVVVFLATLGGALGFMSVYALGRRMGEAVLDPGRFRWLPAAQVAKAQAWLRRWGYGVVVANRFLTGARSVISLAVGMARMNAWKTALCATISAFVWTGTIVYAGYAVGDNWRVIADYLRSYGRAVLLAVGLLVVVQVGRWYWKRRRTSSEGAPLEDADSSEGVREA